MTQTDTQRAEAGQLLAFVERMERLNEDSKAVADLKTELRAEMKSAGYDAKLVNQIVALRAKDPSDRSEEETLLDMYKTALGM